MLNPPKRGVSEGPEAQAGARACRRKARAKLQSRLTVAGDMDSACAVASTSRPPKNRSSTTLSLPRGEGIQFLQGVLQRDQIQLIRLIVAERFIQRDVQSVVPLEAPPPACVIHQNAPDGPRGQRIKLGSILEAKS